MENTKQVSNLITGALQDLMLAESDIKRALREIERSDLDRIDLLTETLDSLTSAIETLSYCEF